MASTRTKRSARPKPKASKPKAKRATPAKSAKGAAKPSPKAKSAPKPVKSAARPAKAPLAKGVKAPAKAALKPPAKPVGKAAVKGKKMPAPPPVVKPLGVLPPESRVRVVEKPLPARPQPKPLVSAATKTATQGVQRVTEKDMKFFEERLLADRQKILKDMGHLETTVLKVNQRDSSGDLSGYSFHMADAGTDAMEREKAFMFASSEGRMLLEVDDALRRLYKGEYGICESCGNPIGHARLVAMPYARLCVSCKEKEEKASRGQNQNQGPGPGNP